MKEVLVIETGELLDIKFHYKMMKFEFELPKDFINKSENQTVETWVKHDSKGNIHSGSMDSKNEKDIPYYILSDGNKYLEKELIVGLDNIREYRIKNIIE